MPSSERRTRKNRFELEPVPLADRLENNHKGGLHSLGENIPVYLAFIY